MLADKSLIHGPAYYSISWTLIGLVFLLGAGLIIFLIFFSTRKKEIKTLAHLKPQTPVVIDLTELRNKYMGMVASVISRYNSRRIRASVAHQELSIIVRMFYAEAGGFHAEFLTLNDLKRSRVKRLAKVIEAYYPNEFNMLEQGSVANAAEEARRLIMSNEPIERKKL